MNNRFCRQPWSFVEVHSDGKVWNCCPSWITKPMGNILEQSWEEVWNGKIAQEYRDELMKNYSVKYKSHSHIYAHTQTYTIFGGERGIRTPGTINSYASLANWWFQPLTHLTR